MDVVTFGSATWDIFIRDKEINRAPNNVCFSLGAKIDIDELCASTGGGATNSLATFLAQGFRAAYCGAVGKDLAGKEIINDLKNRGANISLIHESSKKPSNHSIIFSVPKRDRTIFSYKGASEDFSFKKAINKGTRAKWFYIAPLSGKLTSSFQWLVNFAITNNIRIAINPGQNQLSPSYKKTLAKADILILNQEEASILAEIPYSKEKEIIRKILTFYSGIFVMTKGTKGAIVCSDNKIYKVKILKSKVVDRTGAGDSFGSGFVASIMKGEDIKSAIQFASANATSCLGKWGAKNGLLKKGENYRKIKVDIYETY